MPAFEEVAYLLLRGQTADAGRTRRLHREDQSQSRAAGCAENRAGDGTGRRAPDGRSAHRRFVPRQHRAGRRLLEPGRHGRSAAFMPAVNAALLASLSTRTGCASTPKRSDDSIAGHFLHMLHDAEPKELHRKSLDTTLILVCRARVQCVDVYRSRHHGDAVRHALCRRRRDRSVKRTPARWRERSRDGADIEVSTRRRRRTAGIHETCSRARP